MAQRSGLERVPTLLAALCAFAAAAPLVSWYLQSLRQVTPPGEYVAMQYTTSLAFVVAGAAAVAHGARRRRIAFWCGLAAAGLGSLALGEHLLGRSVGLVEALFGGPFVAPGIQRASAHAALTLALACGVPLATHVPGASPAVRRRLVTVIAAAVAASGFVGLLGWARPDPVQQGFAHLSSMEWHAVLGFVLVGSAFFVMIVRMREAPGATVLPGWTAWSVGLTVAALSFALWTSLTTSDARTRSLTAMDAHQAALAHANQFLQTRLHTLRRFALLHDGRPMERNPQACRTAESLLEDLPGLQSVGWIDREGHAEWALGTLTPRALHDALEQRPELRSALRAAQRERLTAVSDPATVLGRHDEVYVFVPVIATGQLAGVLSFGHGVEPLFDAIFAERAGSDFKVELATESGVPFYASAGVPARHPSTARAGAALTSGRIAFGDQVWRLGGWPEAATRAGGRNASGTLVLWFGLFLSVALVFVIRKSELLRERAASLSQAKATIERHAHSLREANGSLLDQASDLRQAQARLTSAARDKRSVLDSLSAFLIGVDHAGRVIEWNSVASRLFGIPVDQALFRDFDGLPLPWDRRIVGDAVAECLATGERVKRDHLTVTGGDAPRTVSITVNPTQTEGGRGWAIIGADVTERLQLETQLHQAQRLESVGTLAAGIAHEINTPMQFVGDNLRFVSQCVPGLSSLLALVPELVQAAGQGKLRPALARRLRAAAGGVDVGFLAEELPSALGEMEEGVRRVTTIVRAMKDFSHPGQQSRQSADLNQALDTTLAVARNEYKYYADIETDFGPLPPVDCFVADLNQVFLNLVVNAAHAIRDTVEQGGPRGTIRIATRAEGDEVEIRVGDTGTGIPAAIRDKIFDQFFTTKPIGRGTGMGLAIVRAVVVDKHRGSVRFESEEGAGTTFIVRIPVAPRAESIPA
ncbi:MAG TPA: ATP-binding protein [Planctomycetota bacterium]|nr:ATP-binding protein [Planctomycetota bacterium]